MTLKRVGFLSSTIIVFTFLILIFSRLTSGTAVPVAPSEAVVSTAVVQQATTVEQAITTVQMDATVEQAMTTGQTDAAVPPATMTQTTEAVQQAATVEQSVIVYATAVPDGGASNPVYTSTKIDPAIAQYMAADGYAEVVINLLDSETILNAAIEQIPGLIATAQAEVIAQLALNADDILVMYDHVPAMTVRVTEDMLETLVLDNRVTYVQHNGETKAAIAETMVDLGLVDLLGSRTVPQTGVGSLMVVLDSGINPNHALFDNANGSAIIARDCVTGVSDCDYGAHGTLMAAIIRSIAPATELIDIQVLNQDGSGTVANWLAGLDTVITLSETREINAVNMSLATTATYFGQCDSVHTAASIAVAQLLQRGITVFAAAGNEGKDALMSAPACIEDVVAVGGVYSQITPLTVAPFTNRGINLDLLAPSTNLEVTGITTEPTFGTSQATASVTGLSALNFEANQYLTPRQLLSILQTTGTPVTVTTVMGSRVVPAVQGQRAVTEADATEFACSSVTSIPLRECAALVTLYNSLGGANWLNKTGWLQDFEPCNWYGVECLNGTGNVTSLRLDNNLLNGTIPAAIADLTQLVELFVAHNQLGGTLPTQMASMSQLTSADFGYNKLNIYGLSAQLDGFILGIDADWKQTQTYAPINVFAVALSRHVLSVFWSPIFYTDSPGYYEVRCGTQSGGPYNAFTTQTSDKSASIVTFRAADGVTADTDYYCVVRTISNINPDTPVLLTSPFSQEDFGSTRPEGIGEDTVPFQTVADTFISSGRPNTNSGGDRGMMVGSYTDFTIGGAVFSDSYTLLDFGIGGLPLEVESVTLRLAVYGVNANPDTIAARSIGFSWTDALTYNQAPTPLTSAFNFASGVTLPPCAAITACNDTGNDALIIEIPLAVDSITELQSASNYGIYLANTNDNGRPGAVFCSRDIVGGTPCDNQTVVPTLNIRFEQVPGAFNPTPAINEIGVAVNPVLGWQSLPDAQGNPLRFDLYAGSTATNLTLIASDLTTPTYSGLPTPIGAEVFWRVDTKDSEGNVNTGTVWNFTTTFCDPLGTVAVSECQALSEFFDATNGIVWNATLPANETWLERPVCEWAGVECLADSVVQLDLSSYGVNLVGDDISALTGLSNLQTLNLSTGKLNGEIPALTAFPNLVSINLSGHELQGYLPEVTGLNQLTAIDFSGNQLIGTIPASYGQLPALLNFDVRDNKLEGSPFAVLSNIATLQTLDLSQNLFNGELTNVALLQNLQQLEVAYNAFYGFLSPELATLAQLTVLDLSHNRFELPSAVANVHGIPVIDAADLQTLTDWLNSFPLTWTDSQTVPPINLDPTEFDNSIDLTWTPRTVLAGYEGYTCAVSAIQDESLLTYRFTTSHSVTSVVVDELFPNEVYTCWVVSITPATGLQKSTLYSRPVTVLAKTTQNQALTNDINNPIPIPALPYKYVVDTSISFDADDDVPECVSDASGRRYGSYSYGGDGQNVPKAIRIEGDGLDGADAAIAVIIRDSDGNLVYIECQTSLDESMTSAGDITGQRLQGDDVAFDIILQPGETYYFVVMNEAGAFGRVNLSIEEMTFSTCTDAIGVSTAECQSLVDFYFSTQGQQWRNNDGWLTNRDVCTWYGVLCADGHVVSLFMPNNLLYGYIPASFGNLQYMTVFNLYYNELKGAIPVEFTNLMLLRVADLSNNQLYAMQPSVQQFVTNVDPNWFETQTIAPFASSVNFTTLSPTSVRISWEAIAYNNGDGYYAVGYATSSAGPFTYVTVSGGKNATYLDIPDLRGDLPYFFHLATTSIETIHQQRTVTSEYSAVREYRRPFTDTIVGPMVLNDSLITKRNASSLIDVLINDVALDNGGSLTIVAISDPLHGEAELNGNGLIRYKPDNHYIGDDQFTYTVEDELGRQATATVFVIVGDAVDESNQVPLAVDDSFTTTAGVAITIDVLSNDIDPEGQILQIVDISAPQHGRIVQNPDGTLLYIPDASYSGLDSFNYIVQDNQFATDSATVSITISGTNVILIAMNDSITIEGNHAVIIDVLANDLHADGDSLEVIAVGESQYGQVRIIGNGQIQYNSDNGYRGMDRFAYTITDTNGVLATAEVSIMIVDEANTTVVTDVTPETEILVIEPLSETDTPVTDVTPETEILVIEPLPETDTPVTNVTPETEILVIEPLPETEVVVEVSPEPVTIELADDSYTVNQNAVAIINPLENDSAYDGSTLFIVSITEPQHGMVILMGNDSLQYNPTNGYTGSDIFTYSVMDSNGVIWSATVTITVE